VRLAAAIALALAGPAQAEAPAAAPPAAHEEEDKTGTDPSKFLRTLIAYNEFRSLGDERGFDEMVYRYIQPIEKVKFQLTLPLDRTDASGVSESGFGDVGLKASYLPRRSSKFALVLFLDSTYPTSTKSVFGTGKYVAIPGATFAFFFDGGKVIFAPSLQQKFSYAGDAERGTVNQTLVDTYFVYKPTKASWIIVDPQFVLDHENDTFFNTTEVEYGRLMFAGVSTYVRPGIGLGSDKPADWNLEFGVKVVH
jgi:hypothetical protein